MADPKPLTREEAQQYTKSLRLDEAEKKIMETCLQDPGVMRSFNATLKATEAYDKACKPENFGMRDDSDVDDKDVDDKGKLNKNKGKLKSAFIKGKFRPAITRDPDVIYDDEQLKIYQFKEKMTPELLKEDQKIFDDFKKVHDSKVDAKNALLESIREKLVAAALPADDAEMVMDKLDNIRDKNEAFRKRVEEFSVKPQPEAEKKPDVKTSQNDFKGLLENAGQVLLADAGDPKRLPNILAGKANGIL